MSTTVAKKSENTITTKEILLIAGLEGFATLAVEILVLRLAIPVVWSSIVLTSVFLGIILLALSAGYYVWWRRAERLTSKSIIQVMAVLLWGSALRYWLITFALEQQTIALLLQMTWSYMRTLFLAAMLLCFVPVFSASQAVPLLTQLIPISSKWRSAGTLLFVSTIGSFVWSIGTSSLLLPIYGVHVTGCIVVWVLFVCVLILLVRQRLWRRVGLTSVGMGALIVHAYYGAPTLPGTRFVQETSYQEIRIIDYTIEGESVRVFHTNMAFASWIWIASRKSPFGYIREMAAAAELRQPKKILVVGAAWFTLPYELAKLSYVEQIDVIDIDPAVKPIAEQYFLEEPLSPKITFIPRSARYALQLLSGERTTYDMIFLDAYNGKSIPEELTTVEFFDQVNHVLAPQGSVVANMILDRARSSTYAQTLFATRWHVRWSPWVYDASDASWWKLINTIVSNTQMTPAYEQRTSAATVATDDKRTTDVDGVAMYRF